MFFEIYFTLRFIISFLQVTVTLRVLYNFYRKKTLYDLQLLFLFILAAGVTIFEQTMLFLLLFAPISYIYDTILILFGIGVLSSYTGFTIISYLLFRQAERVEVGKNYWKPWITTVFITLFFVSIYLVSNSRIIELREGDYYYITIVAFNFQINTLLLIICEIVFLPYLIKAIHLSMKIKGKKTSRRILITGIHYELVGFITYFGIAYVISMEMVIISIFIELITAIIVFYFFYPSNIGESLFIQLNIETIYIIDGKGDVMHQYTFMGGINKNSHDKLVGGLVKASSSAVGEIKRIKDKNLRRMILDDGTAIIIENSDISDRCYTLFTRNYTNFIQEKMINLRKMLDNIFLEKEKQNLLNISSDQLRIMVEKVFTS